MTQNTVIVVGGPAGIGKTTIAELLSAQFACPFIEGDSLHPPENIEKMSKGIPLTDEDRWGWLRQLSEEASEKAISPENKSKICIVLCSMLKRVYRSYIKKSSSEKFPHNELKFRFLFLHTTFEDLMKRVSGRKGHYMKSDMVKSQYDIMEIPNGDELVANGGECLAVDTTNKTPEEILRDIINQIN